MGRISLSNWGTSSSEETWETPSSEALAAFYGRSTADHRAGIGPFFRLLASLEGADRLSWTTAARRGKRHFCPPDSPAQGHREYSKAQIGEVSGCSLPDSLGRGGIVCVAIC